MNENRLDFEIHPKNSVSTWFEKTYIGDKSETINEDLNDREDDIDKERKLLTSPVLNQTKNNMRNSKIKNKNLNESINNHLRNAILNTYHDELILVLDDLLISAQDPVQ